MNTSLICGSPFTNKQRIIISTNIILPHSRDCGGAQAPKRDTKGSPLLG